MSRRFANALTAAIVAAGMALGLASPANAFEGGIDNNGDAHYWIKVPQRDTTADGRSSYGFIFACRRVNSMRNSNGQFPACDQLVPLLVAQKQANPKANGYWAEWYYKSGKTRAGVW